jgi:zinc transporter ZupT
VETSSRGLSKLLFAVEGVGAVFVGVFLAAYLGGLFVVPQTTVFHSEPVVRFALAVLGGALLVLVLATVIVAILKRK